MDDRGGATNTCVVASNRPWNAGMAENLAARIDWRVEAITSPSDLTAERLAAIEPRYVFFPHWSHRIPPEVHETFECVIFHMTDLPFGRGGSPLQHLILRGFEETRISALRCIEELDAGPVYLKRPLRLHGTAEEIYLRASGVIEDMIVELLERQPEPTPQVGEVTVFARRRPDEGDLSAAASLDEVYDMIRMLDAEGYPPAFVDVGELRFSLRRVTRRVDGLHADVHVQLRPRAK